MPQLSPCCSPKEEHNTGTGGRKNGRKIKSLHQSNSLCDRFVLLLMFLTVFVKNKDERREHRLLVTEIQSAVVGPGLG